MNFLSKGNSEVIFFYLPIKIIESISLTITVTKADGTRQLFDREKIVRTCLRMGASRKIAEDVAKKIELKAYEGIPTKKILQMIFRQLSRYKPDVRHRIDLRKALSLMNPKPDFERFVQILLSEHGYEVTPNQIVRGRCVEHEIDGIAKKDGKTYIMEVKHHFDYHAQTSLDVSRIVRAVFEDVTDGFELGLNNLKVDGSLIVCNTKLSEHARRYAECRGIQHIGWSYPPNCDLRTMIEERELYPVTYLKDLDTETKEKLSSAGIILLKQLITKSLEELKKETGIREEILELIIGNAKAILS